MNWTRNARMMLFCALLVILWKGSCFGYSEPAFFFQEQKKCILKTSRKAKMQMFLPAPTIVPPTRYIYINSKLLTHVILQTRRGRCILWKESLKAHANGTIYDPSIISFIKEPSFLYFISNLPEVFFWNVFCKYATPFFEEHIGETASEWIWVMICLARDS